MEKKLSNIRIAQAVFVLILVAGLFYTPVRSFDFIAQYDDQFYLIDNPVLKNPSLGGLVSIFTSFRETDYLPVLYSSYFIDALIWGQDPAGYHAINVLLHILNGILLFLVLSKLLDRPSIAFFVALIFLIHPVQVETVAWVPERKNILSMLFLLLAFYFMMVSSRPWLGMCCFVLALFSKSIAVVFPAFLLLVPRSARNKLPRWAMLIMFALAFGVSVLTFTTQSQVGAVHAYHGGSFWATLALMGQTYWAYLFSLLTGRGLSPIHPIPAVNLFAGLGFYLMAGVVALFLWRSKERLLLRSMAAMFIFLLPVSNIIPIAVLQADRYLYFPIVFFFLALLTVLDRAWHRLSPHTQANRHMGHRSPACPWLCPCHYETFACVR